jgi:hypothetical protein
MSEVEILKILKSNNKGNIICRNLELRPTNLAMFIAALANNVGQFGYIFIGVNVDGDSYEINGVSNDFKIENSLEKALELLTNAPKIEYHFACVKGKRVLMIKVEGNEKDVFFDLRICNDDKIDLFIKDLLRACIKLQANTHFRNVIEDIRNDFIRDLLSMRGYSIKDQTRRGYSASNKSAGEVDIFVELDDIPFTIIEALSLSSLDKSYLGKHLDKIYNYDKNGHKFNICLSYVEVKNFESFWSKYREYASSYSYPLDLVSARTDADAGFPYSEIRFMTTSHNRSGKLTILYHIALKM